jgi:hypothetical protein
VAPATELEVLHAAHAVGIRGRDDLPLVAAELIDGAGAQARRDVALKPGVERSCIHPVQGRDNLCAFLAERPDIAETVRAPLVGAATVA